MTQLPTSKLMVFSTSYLYTLLLRFGSTADYLWGIPLSVRGAELFFTKASKNNIDPQVMSQVQWLVDTPDRLNGYLNLAIKFNLTLRINIEVDIGLHRGGANVSVMVDMLSTMNAHRDFLTFSGLMGYDGHVPNNPLIAIFGEPVYFSSLTTAIESYWNFITTGSAQFPNIFNQSNIALNGAGSNTVSAYAMVNLTSPLNDYALGSAFLKPSDFDIFTLSSLVPALWHATPIVKYMGSQDVVPFLDDWWKFFELDPIYCQGFFLQGLMGSAVAMDPPVYGNPFYSAAASGSDSGGGGSGAATKNHTNYGTNGEGGNLLPTQALFHTNCTFPLENDDFVFWRPMEVDLVVAFGEIWLIRGEQIVGTWETYRGGAS